jgi:hypothetical protein
MLALQDTPEKVFEETREMTDGLNSSVRAAATAAQVRAAKQHHCAGSHGSKGIMMDMRLSAAVLLKMNRKALQESRHTSCLVAMYMAGVVCCLLLLHIKCFY